MHRRSRATWLLGVILLATGRTGCVSERDAAPGGAANPTPVADVAPFPQDHEHALIGGHQVERDMRQVAYHNTVPGDDGADPSARGDWLNAEIIVVDDHAYMSYLGSPWHISITDISDPLAPRLVGALATSGGWTMDIDVSSDGDWVYASIYHGSVGAVFGLGAALASLAPPDGIAAPGVLVIDARDRSAPQVSGFLPIHGFGPHTAVHHEYDDGSEVVFANKADLNTGNAVVIAEVVDTPPGKTLRPLSVYALPGANADWFPHDVDVQTHPVTGETLLYIAYWEAGLTIVDVTDPSSPVLVSRFTDYPNGEEIQLHDTHPFPRLIDGRHYTLSAPEIPTGPASGHLRAYDTTDPANPRLLGSWIMPGAFVVDSPFLFTTHNFQFLPDGRVALAHGHGGVWIIDWMPTIDGEPMVAQAFMVPTAPGTSAVPWSPVAGVPWVWGVGIGTDGTIWASDVASGLYGLRVDP